MPETESVGAADHRLQNPSGQDSGLSPDTACRSREIAGQSLSARRQTAFVILQAPDQPLQTADLRQATAEAHGGERPATTKPGVRFGAIPLEVFLAQERLCRVGSQEAIEYLANIAFALCGVYFSGQHLFRYPCRIFHAGQL